jgi:hypothetical protein
MEEMQQVAMSLTLLYKRLRRESRLKVRKLHNIYIFLVFLVCWIVHRHALTRVIGRCHIWQSDRTPVARIHCIDSRMLKEESRLCQSAGQQRRVEL